MIEKWKIILGIFVLSFLVFVMVSLNIVVNNLGYFFGGC